MCAPVKRLPLLLLLLVACKPLDLQPPEPYAWAVYDPGSGRIPTPNQALVDEDAGHIDLSLDPEGKTPAELAMREWLNTLDGWSTASVAKLEFSEPIDPATVTVASAQVWEWGTEPSVVQDATVVLSEDGLTVEVIPPRHGWARGGTYVVVARGGEDGLRTDDGFEVGPDAAFYYLRLAQRLDEHPRAFSGATRAARQETADSMEALRQSIQPYFEHIEQVGVPRSDIVALWDFRTTSGVEIAMDRESQRVPLPFDLLIDPDTGLVDLSPAEWDTELEADAKLQANRLAGFGLTANPFFELTGPVDPTTLTTETVRLYAVASTAELVPATPLLYADTGPAPCEAAPIDDTCSHVFLQLDDDAIPLDAATTYAIVVTPGLLDLDGRPVAAMSMGRMINLAEPLYTADGSQVGSLDDDTASRLEDVRAETAGLLDALGRDAVTVAWPFTTMDPVPGVRETVAISETLGLHPTPTVLSRKPAWTLIGTDNALASLFPGYGNPGPDLYLGRVDGIGEVVEGTIPMPYFLDAESRRWVHDGTYEMEDVRFLATIPEDVPPGDLKIVVFGHAVVTDRRFLLTIGGRLAREGYGAVAIDFPFHGERIACVDSSLVSTPNFLPEDLQTLTGLTDDMLQFPPCVSGDAATCSPTGECLGPDGQVEDFSSFPIMDLKPVAGAAFLDVDDIAYVSDRFAQSVADLGTLSWSLRTDPTWDGVFGHDIERDEFHYVGMSLGSIIGATYVAVDPAVDRAVFNVAGANMVDLFIGSSWFGPQVDAVMVRNDIEPGSFEAERMLQFATWLLDAVDPLSMAHLYGQDEREAMIQMDRINDDLGDMIIPNHTTQALQRASGLPMLEYPSVLHADLVVPVLGNPMLGDLADFLTEELDP